MRMYGSVRGAVSNGRPYRDNCEEYFLPDSGSRPEKKSVNFFVHEESAAGRIFSAHATEVLYGNAPKRRATIFLKGGEPCLCGNCACSY
jgi:hypothetical protein